jgi:hypothetical protein
MKVQPTAALALPTMKVNTDSQPKTKSNEELVLLRRIIAESKCFRGPASENGQQPPRTFRYRCAPGSDGYSGPGKA